MQQNCDMKKEVLVTIRGTDVSEGHNQETMQDTAQGILYYKKDARYVLFETPAEADGAPVKTRVKIQGRCVEIVKSGSVRTNMRFEQGTHSTVLYETMYGPLSMELRTSFVDIKETTESLVIDLKYELFMEQDLLSAHQVHMQIKNT